MDVAVDEDEEVDELLKVVEVRELAVVFVDLVVEVVVTVDVLVLLLDMLDVDVWDD